MSSPAAVRFMTPKASVLVLRSSASATRQTSVSRGDPLLVTDHLGDGFLEVDWHGERWFALETALEPWRGDAPAAVLMPSPYGAAAPAGSAGPARSVPQAPLVAAPENRSPATSGQRAIPIVIAAVILALLVIVFSVGGFWKYPMGWVVCEGSVKVETVDVIDHDTVLIICQDFHSLRKPFRKYGAVLEIERPYVAWLSLPRAGRPA